MKTVKGILKRSDGEVILMADPDKVGRRERVYAALHACTASTVFPHKTYTLEYWPSRDRVGLVERHGKMNGAFLDNIVKVQLEENAALEEIEAAGCSYVEQ